MFGFNLIGKSLYKFCQTFGPSSHLRLFQVYLLWPAPLASLFLWVS